VSGDDEERLRVEILGPVRAWQGGSELRLGAPQQRGVLAVLATAANRVVSRAELIDALWGERPPASAANGVHVFVAQLRRLLEPQRARREQGAILLTTGRGYELKLDPDHLDAEVFDRQITEARQQHAEGSLTASIRSLETALELWRAAPLADMPGPWAEIERVRLTELRLSAVEERFEVMLALGRHVEAATQLAGLAREYPLRERFSGQLMLALYRCGRRADALAAYSVTRKALVGELGIEPSAALRSVHERVLTADPTLDFASRAGPAIGESKAQPAPRELPADVAGFTGRARELAQLDGLLNAADAEVGAPAIAVVTGTAGVGKTALALRWAHRALAVFPEGQLYVDLRGYDPDQPIAPGDALAGFLRALGVAERDVPARVDERATRFRTLLADRRVLVVLDNAATEEQVRPLLPGSSSCAVLVTSRDALAGLVARHGARRIELDLFAPDDALGLLRALLGGRVDADPEAASTLCEQCARLPLALRVAAEFAAAHPGMSLAALTAELSDEQRRLDLLAAGGDARSAVSAVFSWSYRHLPQAAARAFRLLSLHPGPDFDVFAAAALTGRDLAEGRRVLGVLARGYLIRPTWVDRYDMHDLMKAYGAQLADDEDSAAERRAALTRLFDHYVAAAAAAMEGLAGADRGHPTGTATATQGSTTRVQPVQLVQPVQPMQQIPPVHDPAAARVWLDAERTVLIAVAAYTAANGWTAHATRLAATLFRYLDDGHYTDAITVHGSALQAARRGGDRAAEATALTNLGIAHWRQGRYEAACDHHRQALAIFQEIDDQPGRARAWGNLGVVAWQQGRSDEARGHHEQALAVYRATGDQQGQARAQSNLGLVAWQQARYDDAYGYHERALASYREVGDRLGQARALGNLGAVCERQGRYSRAGDYQCEALAVFRRLGHRTGEAIALSDLADARHGQGCRAEAIGLLDQALLIFREIGDKAGEAETLDRRRQFDAAPVGRRSPSKA
jgi:DNA-binding SARP family transcriptional activator/Tfp pilus assembly protein PilF